jgi:hypothetical protein
MTSRLNLLAQVLRHTSIDKFVNIISAKEKTYKLPYNYLDSELTKEESSSLRFQTSHLVDTTDSILKLGPIAFKFFGLWLSMASPEAINIFLHYTPTIQENKWKEALKSLSDVAKKDLSSEKIYLCDLVDTVYSLGFDSVLERKDILIEAQSWFGKKSEWTSKQKQLFKDAMRKVFLLCTNYDCKSIPLDVYSKMPGYWMTAGSSDERVGSATYGKDKVRMPKTKNALGFMAEPEQILQMLRTPTPMKGRIFIKREPGRKNRAVANVSIPVQIQQNYLMVSCLEKWFKSHPLIPLFYNTAERIDFWSTIFGKFTQLRKKWYVPLDSKGFDHQVRLFMMQMFFEVMLEFLPNTSDVADIRWVAELCLYTMRSKGSFIFDDVTIPWLDGLPSGMSLTSLMDCVINAALMILCLVFSSDKPLDLACQGDDDHIVAYDFDQVRTLYDNITTFGWEINPLKNWVSKEVGEFLRYAFLNVGNAKKIVRYGSRALIGIVIRNPNNPDPRGAVRVDEIVARWLTVASRFHAKDICLDFMRQEISNVTRLPEGAVAKVMHTPKSLGGLGIVPEGAQLLELSIVDESKDERNFYITNPAKLPFLDKLSERQRTSVWNSYFKNSLTKFKFTFSVKEVSRPDRLLTQGAYLDYPVPLRYTEMSSNYDGSMPLWKGDLTRIPYFLEYIGQIYKDDETRIIPFLLEQSVQFYLLLLKKGRSVVTLWLKKGFTFSTPRVLDIGDDDISFVCNFVKSKVMDKFWRRRSITKRTLSIFNIIFETTAARAIELYKQSSNVYRMP